jgi:ribosomal-protein-alanine N-acetyltransferase
VKIIIKKAEPNDIDRLDALEREIFSAPWSREAIEEAIRNNIFYVAKNEMGEIAGYLIAGGDSEEADIHVLAVDSKYRRMGFAEMLLKMFTDTHKPAEIWLEVRESNAPARAFYRKNGFEDRYVRKNYYQNPTENAVVMSKINR